MGKASGTGFQATPPRVSELKRLRRVFLSRGMVVFGLVVLVLLVITAIFANWLAPYDPYKPGVGAPLIGPCNDHLLGTDSLGRDILSRIIYGSRTALMVGFIAVGFGAITGITLGVIAGHFGGILNMIIMRGVDALMCFPMLLLALVVAAVLGSGIGNVIIALGIALIAPYARVTHGLVLSIRENDYIMAERAMGAGDLRIMFRHLLTNAFPPLIVLVTLQLGAAILAEAGLSFLGIGIEPPGAAWGAMV
ncbi:MAG: ABC transporter permease [Dehalococcoidia bacterium]